MKSTAVRARWAEINAKLLDGRVTVGDFARGIGRGERMVYKYLAEGMPAEYVGRTSYIVVDKALDWLLSRKRRQAEPRSRRKKVVQWLRHDHDYAPSKDNNRRVP